MSCLIPEARREAVAQALIAAFGTGEMDRPPVALAGGLSGASLMRIRVGGVPYVLRLETTVSAYGDPALARTYACMRSAAAAMLSPRVWHADSEEGITIIDHIPAVPLAEYHGDGQAFIDELGQALRVLHQMPPFPSGVDFLEGVAALGARLQGSGLLASSVTEEVFVGFERLRELYRPCSEDLVSSHNDLNPANILYDGRRLWLIDWEVAFLADRYLDLASVANWFGQDEAGERRLLGTYLGAEAAREQIARLQLMRQANHVYYGVVFLIGAAAQRPDARLGKEDLSGPSLAQFRQRLRAGEIDLSAWDNRVAYGKARLAAALEAMRDPAFAAALAAL